MGDWNASEFFQAINNGVNNIAGVSGDVAAQSNGIGQMLVAVFLLVIGCAIVYFLFKRMAKGGARR